MTYFQLLNPIITRQIGGWKYRDDNQFVFGEGQHIYYIMDYEFGNGGGFSSADYTIFYEYPS